jgi:hypothetical protein
MSDFDGPDRAVQRRRDLRIGHVLVEPQNDRCSSHRRELPQRVRYEKPVLNARGGRDVQCGRHLLVTLRQKASPVSASNEIDEDAARVGAGIVVSDPAPMPVSPNE